MARDCDGSIADLNGDGKAGLLVGDQTGTLSVVADFSPVTTSALICRIMPAE